LLYVVWIVMLLSLFASSVGAQALFALNLSERLSEQLRASFIARGAVQIAAQIIEDDDTPTVDGLHESWSNAEALFREHGLSGGWFTILGEEGVSPRYGLTDEDRRLNLNAAPAEMLTPLLMSVAGLTREDAEAAAAAIEDWRDEDDDQRPRGAESFYYGSLRHAYACKDGPFENVEELLLVRGITPEIYQRLAPYVTAQGSGRLNLNTAAEATLTSLGLSEEGLDGFLYYRAGEDNRGGTGDDRRLVSINSIHSELASYLPYADIGRFSRLATKGLLGVASETFHASIEAWTEDPAGRVHVDAMIDRKGRVTQWAER
jgi:general secretion pathway protein K